MSKTEANAVTKIDLTNADVKTLTGICYFPNLEIINCYYCNRLTSVDLSYNLKITEIQENAFYSSSLESIFLPSSVKLIKQDAFSYFSTLYCAALTPPDTYHNAFPHTFPSEEFYTRMKFYVPHESVEAYKAADGWKEFADQIVGYDF